ncbi:MAG: hypothetical protein EA411_06495, partial [Saprospirales bacterium]
CNPEYNIKFVIYEGMDLGELCFFQITLIYGDGLNCENQPPGGGTGGYDHSHIDFTADEYNKCSPVNIITEDGSGGGGEGGEGGENGEFNDSTVVENCGEEFNWNLSGSSPLSSLSVGDTIQAYGFPVIVTSVTGSHGDGRFSGTGDVKLPFQNKMGSVDFSPVKLNTSYELLDGEILSFSSNPGELDEIISKLNGFTVDTCLDPDKMSPEKRPGFDEKGNYVGSPPCPGEEDCPCDPDGFDQYGNHCLTGTIYNENGCSVEGLDSLGNYCDPSNSTPFYWHEEGGGTHHGVSLWEEIEDEFGGWIDSLLNEIKVQLDDSLSAVKLSCDAHRASLNNILQQTNMDREFVFGENDKFFSEGMSSNFASAPKKMNYYDNTKDPNIISLENGHVDLYHCDITHSELEDFINQINNIIANSELLEPGAKLIEYLIKNFSEEEVNLFKDPPYEDLKEWIRQELVLWLEVPSDYIVHVEMEGLINEIFDFQPNLRSSTINLASFLPTQIFSRPASPNEASKIMSEIISSENISEIALAANGSNPFPIKVSKEINGQN